MVQPTPAATLENLSRLASKPGVQSTLILSKADGSIIRSTGFLEDHPPSFLPNTTLGDGPTQDAPEGLEDTAASRTSGYKSEAGLDKSSNSAQEVARMVYAFVTSANAFSEGMEKSDEVKLLRLRTRMKEIVIVPDPNFLLIVIHDSPAA